MFLQIIKNSSVILTVYNHPCVRNLPTHFQLTYPLLLSLKQKCYFRKFLLNIFYSYYLSSICKMILYPPYHFAYSGKKKLTPFPPNRYFY